MKTEEQLEAPNELNDLNDVLQMLGPHWRTIAGVSVLVVGSVIAYGLVSTSQTKSRESAWTEFLAASASRDPVQLERIADKGSDSVAAWARQAAAQAKLIEASAAVHSDRAAAKQGFEEAIAGFQKTLSEASGFELIRQRSVWGMAQSYEGLNDLAKAKEHYQQLVNDWPDSAIAKQAQRRIESLNDPKTIAFYEWFFDQTPVATLPDSGEVPNLPFDVPSEPDIVIPDPTDSADTASSENQPGSDVAAEELDETVAGDSEEPSP